MGGGYWTVQVRDLPVVVRPREVIGSGFGSWHGGLLAASDCEENECSVPQFPQSS